MIFVTVGTYERPFDRLVKEVDRLKAEGFIEDDVFMQIGYSIYLPRSCDYKRLIRFQNMQQLFLERSNQEWPHLKKNSYTFLKYELIRVLNISLFLICYYDK